ncbi:transcription-repair coupling factor [uncultured Phascolarctobacterium sp.]|jgi:transcription-repair coupling factor (superfamily II helicase)|uniref:transcription-repair coupling factor n=1 Tax=uncultured Phascolarctobacterium sp. TaxID=512296 RepID=UPI0015AFCC3E|nr:transcription-repair coupling factor [uncultured Phascolarctobacterium sp.]
MKLQLLDAIGAITEARSAAELWQQGRGCSLTGLSGAAKTVFLAALDRLLPEQGSLVFLLSGRDDIREYRRTLNCFYSDLLMQELYPVDLPRVQADSRNRELQAGRVAALRILQGEEHGIVFVTAEALLQKLPVPQQVLGSGVVVTLGQQLEQQELLERLIELGYERTEQVDAIGQFCLRGDILDIFPINSQHPARIEWFDDTIDAMRSFDLDNQRSIEALSAVKIVPLQIDSSEDFSASVLDYLSPSTRLVIDEPSRLFELLQKLHTESAGYADELWTPGELEGFCARSRAWVVAALGHSHLQFFKDITVPVRSVAPYNRNLELLTGDLQGWLADGQVPVVMMSSDIKARGLADSLQSRNLNAAFVKEGAFLQPGRITVISGELTAGFRFWNENWLLLTENDIFGMQKKRRLHTKNSGAQLQYFSEIKAGDYVVHAVHGIGRYIGVENVLVDGVHRDYLLLAYAGDDKLYVPVEQVGMLHKYVGNEGQAPRLSKMGGADWKRVQSRARAAITELAEELLRLYAQRKIVPGYAFAEDTEWQRDFEERFPYEETPDQLKAIAEIKADMEKPEPMDRLLCGDVGYGKTEVAIRAAFKAVMDGKQVAVMVPTTVLAQQHFMTFKERMQPFGVKVEMVSRFCTPREQKRILNDLENGQVDVLIGTHRLLQPDVLFPDLGLLVIDEEQRFGVAQKEKIKRWKTGVDVLTLSATPIPRTLHLALVNGRDMSVIESPPEERLPVETYVAEYNPGMIKEALERELRRGGRIYYVHNRVLGLENIAADLRSLVPGINIRIAHGQMPEDMLEDAMIAFYEGSCDVLLSTSIIENGLDVPLANTIIIDGAENFGLSQLYQMRGRVGRSSRLAYAYFVYKRNRALSEVAEKRLQAIRDFTELGAGFKIAMRDLEIRGAGNLLGAQQHGHIAGVGFAAYCDMLERTIRKLKDGVEDGVPEPDPVLEISVDGYIPDDYIADPRYKLELYRRFAGLDYAGRGDLLDEIIDRFGEPPEEVEVLWRVACLRALCRLLHIRGISVKQGEIRITFAENAAVDPAALMQLIGEHQQYMQFKSGAQAQLIFRTVKLKTDSLTWLEKNLPRLALD